MLAIKLGVGECYRFPFTKEAKLKVMWSGFCFHLRLPRDGRRRGVA